MLFTKVALVTGAFYVGLNILLEAGLLGLSHWKGSAGIFFTHGGRYIFFGILWLISYSAAWRIVAAPLFARLQR